MILRTPRRRWVGRGVSTASQRRDHSVVPKNAGARSRQAHEIAGRL